MQKCIPRYIQGVAISPHAHAVAGASREESKRFCDGIYRATFALLHHLQGAFRFAARSIKFTTKCVSLHEKEERRQWKSLFLVAFPKVRPACAFVLQEFKGFGQEQKKVKKV
jgi:hypothetical protein